MTRPRSYRPLIISDTDAPVLIANSSERAPDRDHLTHLRTLLVEPASIQNRKTATRLLGLLKSLPPPVKKRQAAELEIGITVMHWLRDVYSDLVLEDTPLVSRMVHFLVAAGQEEKVWQWIKKPNRSASKKDMRPALKYCWRRMAVHGLVREKGREVRGSMDPAIAVYSRAKESNVLVPLESAADYLVVQLTTPKSSIMTASNKDMDSDTDAEPAATENSVSDEGSPTDDSAQAYANGVKAYDFDKASQLENCGLKYPHTNPESWDWFFSVLNSRNWSYRQLAALRLFHPTTPSPNLFIDVLARVARNPQHGVRLITDAGLKRQWRWWCERCAALLRNSGGKKEGLIRWIGSLVDAHFKEMPSQRMRSEMDHAFPAQDERGGAGRVPITYCIEGLTSNK